MAYPVDVTTVVVNGSFTAAQPSGAVPSGTVSFYPNVILVDAGTGVIIEPALVTATLDVAGAFSVTLMSTDDTSVQPAGWAYWVRERIDGYGERVYVVQLPAAGTPFRLGDLTHLTTPPAVTTFVLVSQIGQPLGVASLDGSGQVPASQLGNASGGGGVPSSRTITTTAPLTGGGDLSANRTLAISGATGATVGAVQLAGDLGGTATAPTVPGLAGKAALAHGHVESDVTSLVSDLAGKSAVGHGHAESDVTSLVADLAAKVAKSTVTTKGDLFVATAASTPARLGVGADTQVLTADSAQATGVKWAAAAGGGGAGMDQVFPVLSGYGLKAASGDPNTYLSVGAPGNGTIFFNRVWIPAGVAFDTLCIAIRDAGIHDGATVGNRLGLFDDAGTQLDLTAEDPAIFTTNGWRTKVLLGGTQASQGSGRFVYLAPLYRGMTTGPNFASLTSANDANANWWSLPAGGSANRRCTFIGGQTTMPGSFNPTSSGTLTTFELLMGVK